MKGNNESALLGKQTTLVVGSLAYLLEKNPESWKILWGLHAIEPLTRHECCQNTYQLLISWFHGFGSPKEADVLNNPEVLSYQWGDTSMFYLIEEQLPDLLRLQCTAPLKEIRLWCSGMMAELQNLGLRIPRPVHDGPSSFIDWSELTHLHNYMEDSSSTISTLFLHHFHKWGRVENYLMLMGFHPEYLECYLKFFHHVIYDNCPLPYVERHFICIMAAARHQCTQLMRLHIIQFILHGGDSAWLTSITAAPQRLQSLMKLNAILAHEPWSIQPEDIKALSLAGASPEGTYSLSELMHAITLLCHTHALCSFVYSCGITPELDDVPGHTHLTSGTSNGQANEMHSKSPPPEINHFTATAEIDMKVLSEVSALESQFFAEEEVVHRYQQVLMDNQKIVQSLKPPFISTEDSILVNFEFNSEPPQPNREKEQDIFRIQDFNWEIDGVTVVDNCLAEVGVLLHDRFLNIYDLTYCTFGNHFGVDTTSFRRALWNYIHSVYFIRHDDYNYVGVEQLLSWQLRSYMHRVVTAPSTITQEHYNQILVNFKPAEKVQVNLLLMEARLQATLLYSLRAIKRSST